LAFEPDYDISSQFPQLPPPGKLPGESDKPIKLLSDLIESGLIKKGKALDICCGIGTTAMYLARNGFDVTGIDISPATLNADADTSGLKIGHKFLLKEKDIILPFKSNKFDFIVDIGCFHQIRAELRQYYINQIREILKKTGTFFLVTLSYMNGEEWNQFTQRKLLKYFTPHFKIKFLKHFSSFEIDGETFHFYAFLMQKR